MAKDLLTSANDTVRVDILLLLITTCFKGLKDVGGLIVLRSYLPLV